MLSKFVRLCGAIKRVVRWPSLYLLLSHPSGYIVVAEHNALGDAGCGGWLRLLAIRDVDGHGLDLVGRQRLLAPV